ncbi:hypothetical protein R1sor_024723 [Riccia sorocarpa]|uniref:Reverse transcriptase zinc-binding domain-containing protein n=1 Tax=Riccia sorocarpa TaxID=122646 RepID=A0ABD3GRA5_9MARC
MDSWKAARARRNEALTAAVKSVDCIRKNKARFDQLHTLNMEDIPYPKTANGKAAAATPILVASNNPYGALEVDDQEEENEELGAGTGHINVAVSNAVVPPNSPKSQPSPTHSKGTPHPIISAMDISSVGQNPISMEVAKEKCKRELLATLQSTQTLHLQQDLKKIDSACRRFVSGKNTEGKDKIPLITWEVLHRPKGEGGLGMPPFSLQSAAMRLKQLLRAFQDQDEDWIAAFGAMISLTCARRYNQRALRDCNLKEILMTSPPFRITGANITSGFPCILGTRPESSYRLISRRCCWEETDRLLPTKEKLWMWLLLQHGFLTLDMAKKWGKGNGICPRCKQLEETPDHLFWNCRHSGNKWADFRFATENLDCAITHSPNFIDTFDTAFKHQNPGRYTSFLVMNRSLWLERNEAAFSDRRRNFPMSRLLSSVADTLVAQKQDRDQTSKAYILLDNVETSGRRAIERIKPTESGTQTLTQTSNPDTDAISTPPAVLERTHP